MAAIIFILVATLFTIAWQASVVSASEPCSPALIVCDYTFNVEEDYSMTSPWHRGLVSVTKERKKEQKNEGTFLNNFISRRGWMSDTVQPDNVVTLDGYRRLVTLVNGKFPGPPIIVTEGQEVIVTVNNKLNKDVVAIHWHGITMKNTPWMDGVPYVTQCPIAPGQTFVYTFVADVPGTYFYHSHMSGQRADGLVGALIVKEKVPRFPNAEDVIMHIGDWFHDTTAEVDAKMENGWYELQDYEHFEKSTTVDGVSIATPNITVNSVLVEGKGKYYNPKDHIEDIQDINDVIRTSFVEKWSETPYKEYIVTQGSEYRFRVINSGVVSPLRVSVDHHKLVAVASDGFDFQPVRVQSIIVYPGERYDFMLTADQGEELKERRKIKDYWIRVNRMNASLA